MSFQAVKKDCLNRIIVLVKIMLCIRMINPLPDADTSEIMKFTISTLLLKDGEAVFNQKQS
jgi:hypothetical protein